MKPELSIVVPAHNSGERLSVTLTTLARELHRDDVEVIIVENGSTDDTWECAQRLTREEFPFTVTASRSATGLGAAYQEGIRCARGETVLLTADDLPFGLTDVRSWEQVRQSPSLVVGSKAHRRSVVPRGLARAVMSGGFRLMRLVVLGMTVADCQGTIFAPRRWLVENLPSLREIGYLTSTEIVHLAQQQGLPIIEVPVTLSPSHQGGGTRIRVRDVSDMAAGLLRLRRRRREFQGKGVWR